MIVTQGETQEVKKEMKAVEKDGSAYLCLGGFFNWTSASLILKSSNDEVATTDCGREFHDGITAGKKVSL